MFGCVVCVVGCVLRFVRCLLCDLCRALCVARCVLFIVFVCRVLCWVRCPLFVVRCLLGVACCVLLVDC